MKTVLTFLALFLVTSSSAFPFIQGGGNRDPRISPGGGGYEYKGDPKDPKEDRRGVAKWMQNSSSGNGPKKIQSNDDVSGPSGDPKTAVLLPDYASNDPNPRRK